MLHYHCLRTSYASYFRNLHCTGLGRLDAEAITMFEIFPPSLHKGAGRIPASLGPLLSPIIMENMRVAIGDLAYNLDYRSGCHGQPCPWKVSAAPRGPQPIDTCLSLQNTFEELSICSRRCCSGKQNHFHRTAVQRTTHQGSICYYC